MKLSCGLRANFALILKHWRLQHHIPQKQMAIELGFGNSTVGAWETGERFPTDFALESIADYTRITPCRLICPRAVGCAPGQCRFLMARA